MKKVVQALCIVLIIVGFAFEFCAIGAMENDAITLGAFFLQSGFGIVLLAIGTWISNRIMW